MSALLLFKILIVLSAGAVIFAAALSAAGVLTRAAQGIAGSGRKAGSLSIAAGRGYARRQLEILARDPVSPRSRKPKLLLSLFVLLASFLLLNKIVFSLLLAALAYFAIGWYFNRGNKMKTALFDDQLIEALGMLTHSVRAGQSLQQSLENLVKDTRPPLSLELEEAVRQVHLGASLKDALNALSDRMDSRELKLAVTSINLSRETGASLGEILTQLSSTMRERKKIQGKIRALTAQGKASGMVMACVPLLLLGLLYFMQPDVVGLMFTTTLGNIMLAIAAAMIFTAVFVINRIIDIDI